MINEHFSFSKIIGQGAFGIVVEAVNKEGTNVAMKV